MGVSNDLPDNDPIDDGASSGGSDKGNSSNEDFKKRFNGLNSLYNKLRAQLEREQAEHDADISKYEQQINDLRRKGTDVDKATKDLKDQLDKLNSEKSQSEKELENLKAEKTARQLISGEFKALTGMFDEGLLRSRSEFDSDDSFKTYLTNMAKYAAAQSVPADSDEDEEVPEEPIDSLRQQRRILSGAIPPTPSRSRDTSPKKTIAQLTDELDGLDPKKDAKRHAEIISLMDELLG